MKKVTNSLFTWKAKSKNNLFSFKPISVKPVKLAIYPKRTRKELRLINTRPYLDNDHDRVMNWFDCRPLNKKKQDFGAFKPQGGREVEELTAAERFGTRNIKKLKRISSGRDRTVYQLDKDKVLKIAKNPGGIRQNEAEQQLGNYLEELKHYESGKDYVVMEKAGKLTPELKRRLKVMFKEARAKRLGRDEVDPGVIGSYGLEEENIPGKRLINPELKNYDLSGDILKLSSWGEKEGHPVVIDAGSLFRWVPQEEHRITAMKRMLRQNAKPDRMTFAGMPVYKKLEEGEAKVLSSEVSEWEDIARQRKKFAEKGKKEDEIPHYLKGGPEMPDVLENFPAKKIIPPISWAGSEEYANEGFNFTKRTIKLPPEQVLKILKSQEEGTIDLPQEEFEKQLKEGYPLESLKEAMEGGAVIHSPSITFAEKFDENNPDEWSGAHGEGRHRALAAKELGAEEIPVDIMEDRTYEEGD